MKKILMVSILGIILGVSLGFTGETNQGQYLQQAVKLAATPFTQKTATEAVMLTEPKWCPQGCIGLSEWNQLVPDGLLRGSLVLAYHYYPQWRYYAKRATQKGTRIFFSSEPKDPIQGFYRATTNTIEISEQLRHEQSSIVAAIAAHEIVHAALSDPHPFKTKEDVAACIEEEVLAYTWQALIWQKLRKGDEQSKNADSLNHLISLWEGKKLQEMVLSYKWYQQSCFGRELKQ